MPDLNVISVTVLTLNHIIISFNVVVALKFVRGVWVEAGINTSPGVLASIVIMYFVICIIYVSKVSKTSS